MAYCNLCCLYIPEDTLEILNTDDHQCILVLQFLSQMYAHDNDDNFWKEDTKKAFSTFRSAYLDTGENCFSEM